MTESALLQRAAHLDATDPLAGYRDRFYIPTGKVYLDGNSLGLLSRDAERAVLGALEDWKRLGVDGWLEAQPAWFTLAEQVAGAMAALMGAAPGEVAVASSTTVNLHQALATLYAPAGRRTRILVDDACFPSDRYAVASHLGLRGRDPARDLVVVRSEPDRLLDVDVIIAALDQQVALALLPSVVYTTGQLVPMARLARCAREAGVTIGFDCSHSAGLLPHALSEWGVDFAIWCGYKYLNGGPGACAGLFLNRRHHGRPPGMAGWFGADKAKQFDMAPELAPAQDAGALQIGTPHILSLAPLLESTAMLQEAGIERVHARSLALTGYLIELCDGLAERHGLRRITPRAGEQRGGHVALQHPEAARVCKALKQRGIVPDFRPPDIVRLAPAPLYNTFTDCASAYLALRDILERNEYQSLPEGRNLVA